MTYPKAVMNLTELSQMGFPKSFLMKAVHCEYANHYVFRSGKGKTSQYYIKTEIFDKYVNEIGKEN